MEKRAYTSEMSTGHPYIERRTFTHRGCTQITSRWSNAPEAQRHSRFTYSLLWFINHPLTYRNTAMLLLHGGKYNHSKRCRDSPVTELVVLSYAWQFDCKYCFYFMFFSYAAVCICCHRSNRVFHRIVNLLPINTHILSHTNVVIALAHIRHAINILKISLEQFFYVILYVLWRCLFIPHNIHLIK